MALWQAKGFELSYLEKVTEVKDTVHRQSLLHHTCNFVVENYPDTTDLYSEIPAITRSAKVGHSDASLYAFLISLFGLSYLLDVTMFNIIYSFEVGFSFHFLFLDFIVAVFFL